MDVQNGEHPDNGPRIVWNRHVYSLLDKSEFTIGRSQDCDLYVITDGYRSSISRRHALILKSPEPGAYLFRVVSDNGAFVNNEHITRNEHRRLTHGTKMSIGNRNGEPEAVFTFFNQEEEHIENENDDDIIFMEADNLFADFDGDEFIDPFVDVEPAIVNVDDVDEPVLALPAEAGSFGAVHQPGGHVMQMGPGELVRYNDVLEVYANVDPPVLRGQPYIAAQNRVVLPVAIADAIVNLDDDDEDDIVFIGQVVNTPEVLPARRVVLVDDENEENEPDNAEPAVEMPRLIAPPLRAEPGLIDGPPPKIRRIDVKTESDGPGPSGSLSGTNMVALDEAILHCSICLDICHHAASIAPCNHKFCYGCISEWKKQEEDRGVHEVTCPQCRQIIISVHRDAMFEQVIAAFLEANPGSVRPPADITAIEAKEPNPNNVDNNARINRFGILHRHRFEPPRLPPLPPFLQPLPPQFAYFMR